MAVLEYDKKRAKALKEKLGEHQRRLHEHVSGRRLLSDEDHQRTLRQINVFTQHIEQLEAEGYKDKMEKVEDARSSFHNMHKMDYIDFDKTGI